MYDDCYTSGGWDLCVMRPMHVVEDRRIAGIVEYRLIPEGTTLPPVPNSVLNCIAFIYADARGKRQPIGTAFFLDLDDSEIGVRAVYAVTARHVISHTPTEPARPVYIYCIQRS